MAEYGEGGATSRFPRQAENGRAGGCCGPLPSVRFIVPDTRFHQTILEAVDNGMLRSLSGVIQMALTISMYLSLETPRGQRHSVPLHRAVHDAFRARDSDAARAAMGRLIDDAEGDALLKVGGPRKRMAKGVGKNERER